MKYKYEIIKVLDNGYESVEKGEITSDKDYSNTYGELLQLSTEIHGECMLRLSVIDNNYLQRWERMKSMMMQRSVFAA